MSEDAANENLPEVCSEKDCKSMAVWILERNRGEPLAACDAHRRRVLEGKSSRRLLRVVAVGKRVVRVIGGG